MLELDKKNEFVKSVFDYIHGGDINTAVNIFRQLEKKHKILFVPMTEFNKEEFYSDAWIKNTLYPLLDDTQLIIAGDLAANFIEILNDKGCELGVTWRHWGAIIAKWCNENGIEKPLIGKNKSIRWQYIDFYMDSYTSQWIQDYNQWAKAILEVIIEKDKLYSKEYI
jgi:hypothetical protein